MIELLNKLVEHWQIGWQMVAYVVSFVIGVFCLVKFCDIFVDAASSIAKKLKMSAMVIGLTIVAMGTSLPELSVSLGDSINKIGTGENAAIAIGNVVGSNICNVLLVLGCSVVFTPIIVDNKAKKREMPIFLGVMVLLAIFVCLFGQGGIIGTPLITRWEGIVLLVLFVGYIAYTLIMAQRDKAQSASLKTTELQSELLDDTTEDDDDLVQDMSWSKAIILAVVGCVGIILGGQFVNFGAENLAIDGAVALGVNKDLATTLVGLTIVAVGTSLPELVTSVVAAKKGENDIALGNVIGSNIFNALFILGLSATVNPLSEEYHSMIDAGVMFAVALLLFIFAQKGKLGKKHGILFLVLYVIYVAYLCLRTLAV